MCCSSSTSSLHLLLGFAKLAPISSTALCDLCFPFFFHRDCRSQGVDMFRCQRSAGNKSLVREGENEEGGCGHECCSWMLRLYRECEPCRVTGRRNVREVLISGGTEGIGVSPFDLPPFWLQLVSDRWHSWSRGDAEKWDCSSWSYSVSNKECRWVIRGVIILLSVFQASCSEEWIL